VPRECWVRTGSQATLPFLLRRQNPKISRYHTHPSSISHHLRLSSQSLRASSISYRLRSRSLPPRWQHRRRYRYHQQRRRQYRQPRRRYYQPMSINGDGNSINGDGSISANTPPSSSKLPPMIFTWNRWAGSSVYNNCIRSTPIGGGGCLDPHLLVPAPSVFIHSYAPSQPGFMLLQQYPVWHLHHMNIQRSTILPH